MKRMQIDAPLYQAPASTTLTDEYSLASPSQDETSRHSLFVPLHYESKYAYPLLVWLHSGGDNERQLKRVMPLVSLRNYVAIAPQGTTCDDDDDQAKTFSWRQDEADIVQAQWKLRRCMDVASSRCNVNHSRVFIGGYADGGTMALRLALRMPQLFAGAFSIGGPVPKQHAPLVNIERARGLPITLMHGDKSDLYPIDQLCGDLRLLHAAGMGVNVRQYPSEDELTTQMLSDVDAWIMKRVTGAPLCSDEQAVDTRDWN